MKETMTMGTEYYLKGMEKTFGETPTFVSSTLREDGGIPTGAMKINRNGVERYQTLSSSN